MGFHTFIKDNSKLKFDQEISAFFKSVSVMRFIICHWNIKKIIVNYE